MHRLILFLILTCAPSAFAKATTRETAKEPLRVALFDKPPFAYFDEGKLKGFHYILAKAISEKMGRELHAELVPIRRAMELLRQGSVDIVIMTDQSTFEEMKTRKSFLLTVTTIIYTLPSHKPVLAKKDVDANMGRLAGGCADLADIPGIHWNDLKSYEQALDVLLLGRVQSVCGTEAMNPVLNRRKLTSEQVKAYPLQQKAVYVHALPSMSESKWREIDSATQSLVKDGSIERWAREYSKP
jgi:ABC-type amino acid transport substrate-binding protein